MSDYPRVSVDLSYEQALRLSYMARFPSPKQATDWVIADLVDTAIHKAEDQWADARREIDWEKCPCGCPVSMSAEDYPERHGETRGET